MNDSMHSLFGKAAIVGDVLNTSSRSVIGAKLAHELRRQLGLAIVLAVLIQLAPRMEIAANRSSFCSSVSHVVKLIAKEQVGGIDTGRIVAAVTDHKVGWQRAMCKKPAKTVCQEFAAALWIENAVSARHAKTQPRPTIIRSEFRDLRPKLSDLFVAEDG